MDELFHVIDDAQIVLRTKGVYRQVKLYHRNDNLYAGYGAGFIRLLRSGGTSHPNISWESMPHNVKFSDDGCVLRYVKRSIKAS